LISCLRAETYGRSGGNIKRPFPGDAPSKLFTSPAALLL